MLLLGTEHVVAIPFRVTSYSNSYSVRRAVLVLEPEESIGFEVEVSVFSDSPTLSAKAANMGIEVLMDHSRSNNLGPLKWIDAALPPVR